MTTVLIERNLEKNWTRLHALTTTLLISSDAKHLIGLYQKLFARNKEDSTSGKQHTLGLYRAPASKDRHHDFEGGLVAHMLEMWTIWEWMSTMLKNMGLKTFPSHLIWRGIIHHDLNKIHRYVLVQEAPWKVDYADDAANDLLGSTNKSMQILDDIGLPLDIVLRNALLTAEGGYSEAQTKSKTTLASALYLLDDLSANVVDRLRSGRFWDSKAGGGFNEVP